MRDLSLHILDIAENSISAEASLVEIRLEENRRENLLVLEITDNGKGMDEEMRSRALSPFATSRKTRDVGLGLPLLAAAADQAGGRLTLESEPGKGTKVRATFELNHIDLKPLGDIAETILTLIIANPGIEFVYRHRIDGAEYVLDTREVKARLDGVPIHSPEITKFLRNHINKGLNKIRRENEPGKSL